MPGDRAQGCDVEGEAVNDASKWDQDKQKAMDHLADAMKSLFLAAAWLHIAGHSSDGEAVHALAKRVSGELHDMLRRDSDEP